MNRSKIIYSKDLPDVWHEEIEVRDALNWLLVFQDEIPKEVDLKIRLCGHGARGELAAVYIGKGNSDISMNIVILHDAPETYGRVKVRAALFDDSRFILKGLLGIGEHAKDADSYLSAKALLVSGRARAEIHPYLEIKTDEVKASHGSSIGRIDEYTLFYLQNRGVGRDEAQNIMLSGFFGELSPFLS